MPLQAPNLDDRDFKTLVSEARSRIPRYLPEWTDWNESDPGITLLQLHAWLTETILYRLNRLPDLNYIKFLQLLGVERRPARPARANLTFLLKDTVGEAQISISKGTLVTVASPDLPQPLAFETDQTLVAITARLTQVLTLGADAGPGADVTQANLVSGQSFYPFGASPQPGAALLLGFASKGPFSREEIGLQIDLAEAGQAVLAHAAMTRCGASADDADAPVLAWECWDGLHWAPLDVIADETDCLTCSGHIYFKVPGQIPAVSLRSKADGPAAIPLRLTDVAGIGSEQAWSLNKAGIMTVDDLAKLTPQRLAEILQAPVTPEMQDEAQRYVETQLRRAGLTAVASLIGLTDSEREQLKLLIERPRRFLESLKETLTEELKNAPPGAGLTDDQIDDLADIVSGELQSFLAQNPRLVDPLRDALVAILGALRAPPSPGLTDEQIVELVETTIKLYESLFRDEQHLDWEKPLRKALTAVLTALPTPPGQDLTAEQIAALVGPILEGPQFQVYIGADTENAKEAKEAWSDILTTALKSLKLVDLQIETLVEQTAAQIRAMLATLAGTAGVLRQVPMGDLKWKPLMERLSPERVQASKNDQAGKIRDDARHLLAADLLYWLRGRLDRGTYASPPKIDRILTNTVQATAARTVLDEAVGTGTGRPNQLLRLRHAPVLAAPPLELEVEGETWAEVSDFYASQPGDNHYTLNRTSGTIAFGDGTRGRMPPAAGGANIVARQYRYGGGQIGNVGAGTITGLSNSLVEQVTNYRAATGGADEEALADTLLRAPRELKTRDRAVTLNDFELLACETPGAQVARANAYVSSGEPGDTRLINVVIVPQSADPRPLPSEATLRSVCRYLDERRLITTRVVVAGPAYLDIDVFLDARAHPRADLKTVKEAVDTRLQDYLHPLKGGPDGDGWPFGRDIYYSELLHAIMEIDGVRRIESVTLHKFLPRQPIASAVPAVVQPLDTKSTLAIGLAAASAASARKGVSPRMISGGFMSEGAALAQQDALLGLEIATFPGYHAVAKVIPLVVLEQATKLLPIQLFHVVAEYECADLPVPPGALIALHEARVSVSYDRTGGSL